MPKIDDLDIEISASVSKANASLDLLVKRLGKVSASLSGVNTRGLATLGSGVNKLSNAISNFSNNTNTAVFSRLTRNLNSLGNIDQHAIANASTSLTKLANSMKVFDTIHLSDNAKQIGDLAKGIAQLGYKSSTQAIDNIPKLAIAMKDLMATLSTAPRVSQNLIDMTNALAKLARTGTSSGKAATSLGKSLNFFSNSANTAKSRSFSLASAIGKLYATYWLLFRAFGKLGDAIDISSQLTEVQNVVDVTFGKYANLVEKMSSTSIVDYGMSELTTKQVSSRFQAMGTAMGFAQGRMADMSVELTKLTADMASFYNVEQSDVAEDLTAIFTGQTRPLRTYGLDLTQATLKEWAMKQGMDANIESMSQMEKTMLRYQYVLANTGSAQGDFARTVNTWANQTRILKQNFEQLGSVVGKIFINALKPIVQGMNAILTKVTEFAEQLLNALGKIFGWQIEISTTGIADDYADAADGAEDLADGTGKAADNAKKLKQQLQGIDELNVLTSPSDNASGSGGGGSASGGSSDSSGGVQYKLTQDEDFYKSQIDTLEKLGGYVGQTLQKALAKINWDDVYKGASNFGKGLADFLNGILKTKDLFKEMGETGAGAIRTAINAALSFGNELDWKELGTAISDYINGFSEEMNRINPKTGLTGWEELAETLNTYVDGFKTTIKTAFKEINVGEIIKGLFDFADGLELDTITLILGAFAWKYKGKEIALSALGSLLSSEVATGIGSLTVSKGVALGLSITTAIVGFKIGNTLYEKIPTVQEWADSLAEWIFKDGEDIAIARTISVTLSALGIALSATLVAKIPGMISSAILGAYPNGISLTSTAIGKTGIKISGLLLNIGALKITYDNVTGDGTSIGDIIGSALMAGLGTLLLTGSATVSLILAAVVGGFNIGGFIYEYNDTWANCADSLAELIAGFFDGSYSLNDYIQGGIEMGLDLSVKLLNLLLPDGNEIDANTISENWLPKYIASYLFGDETEKQNAINFFANIGLKISETAETFYTNHIKPLLDGVKEKLVAKFNVGITTFSEIKQNLEDFVAKVKEKLKDKFDVSIPTWSDIKGKVDTLVSNVKSKLSAKFGISIPTWSSIKKKITDLVTNIKNKLSASFKIKLPHISLSFEKTAGRTLTDKAWNEIFGGKPKFSVKYYAQGGFPEDGWFRASQGEIMGKFDNGQSVVANNMQITKGISDAVYQGNKQMVSYLQQEVTELRQQNEYLRQIAAKEFGITEKQIGQASQRYAREYSNRTGRPAYI